MSEFRLFEMLCASGSNWTSRTLTFAEPVHYFFGLWFEP